MIGSVRPNYGLARRAVASGLALMLAGPGPALAQSGAPPALPQGGQVAQGTVTIAAPSPSQMVITQDSQRAVVNWNDFSIGAGGLVDVKQPNAAAAILNRVTGGNLSLINGRLQSNGQVYLLNPHGIVVGPGGVIDTAAFLGSILHTSDSDFMAGGPLKFSGDSAAGIMNLGTIRASTGDVALFAPAIVNRGNISAPEGMASLGSGSEILFAPGGATPFLIKAPLPASNSGAHIDNSGVITAAQAELKAAGSPFALAVNNTGVVSATSVSSRGGRVVLDAGTGGVVNSGTLTSRDGDRGGAVDVLGDTVDLAGGSLIDASGVSGGGTVRVGGGWGGKDTSVSNAQTTTVETGAVIRVDATERGDGGSIVVWSDDATRFDGRIEARGGQAGGDGGNAEVSGHTIAFSGRVDLAAAEGRTGTLLVDPVTIDGPTAAAIASNLDTANVTQTAVDSITVSSPITNNATTNTLTLDAPTIAINANITIPNGELDLGDFSTAGTSVTSSSGATISANKVSVKSGYQTVNFAGRILTPVNGLSYNPQTGTPVSFIANNAANQIKNLYLSNGAVSLTGNVDVRSTTSMLVANTLTTAGNLTLVSDGDLAFGGGSPALTVGGTTTLASTGGVFNNNGSLSLLGAGRKIIYSSTDTGAFNVTGLGYTQVNPVAFPNDPKGSGNVIYLLTASSLPLLTITADNKSIVYGSSDPAFTASYSGGSASGLTLPVLFQVTGAHSNVGSYTITPYGATSSTYRLSFAQGTLTVTPAVLTITASDFTRTYGSPNPTFSATASTLFNGDTLSSVVPSLSFSTPATKTSNVGTYAITPSGVSASPNYTLQFVPGTLTVNKASLTVSANDVSRRYGAQNPSFAASFSGLFNGDSSSVVSGLTFTTNASERSPVGTYVIELSGGTATNYDVVPFSGTLTVTPAPLTVTTSSAIVVYGKPAPMLFNTYSGLVLGDTASSLGLGYSTSVKAGTRVGDYLTSLSGRAPNYDITYRPGTISITPAPLWIVANNAHKYQGRPNPKFEASVSGLFGDDTVNNLKVTTTAVDGSPDGTYPIVPSSDPMPNYDVTYVNGTLSVEEQILLSTTVLPTYELNKEQQEELLKDKPQTVVLMVDFLGGGGSPGIGRETRKVIDTFVSAMAKMGITVTANKVFSELQNPATRSSMLGTLLPYLFDAVKDILNLPASERTSDQRELLTSVENYIQTTKVAAAKKAQADYAAWKAELDWKAQNAGSKEGSGVQTGVSGVYQGMADSANPEAPPPEFLAQAQAGVVLTNDQLKAYAGMQAKIADIQDQVLAVPFLAAAHEIQWLTDAINLSSMTAQEKTVQLNRLQQNIALIQSDDPARQQQGLRLIAEGYKKSGGPDINVKSLMSGTSTSDSTAGFTAGALSEVGKVGLLLQTSHDGAVDAYQLLDAAPILKGAFKHFARGEDGTLVLVGHRTTAQIAKLKAARALKPMEYVEDGFRLTDKVVEGAENAVDALAQVGKVVKVVGQVLAVGSVVLEVVGNLVQIGIGVAGYAGRADYEKALNTASADAQKPVDLNSMSQSTLLSYLTAMAASGGQVSGQ